ncbi:hypothetical protein TNCV_4379301 [Trichonephila clavipes]|nr:hypothetical protein TNCV_4379301 [Trichonephila clavipes]
MHCRPTGIVVIDADCDVAVTGFESGEDMDVCKCIVPLRYLGTLNSHRAALPLVWLKEGVKWWEAPDHPSVEEKKHQYADSFYGNGQLFEQLNYDFLVKLQDVY